MIPKRLFQYALPVLLLTGLASQQEASAKLALEGGESIAFMGDSITQAGHNRKDGYVNLVVEALNH